MKIGWEMKKLGDVCSELFAGGDVPKNNFSIEKSEQFNIPIIANAVKDSGLYGYSDISKVVQPSITIAARGSGTGHTEIRYEPFFPIVRLIVLTPKVNIITLEYLKYSVQNLNILSNGSAIPQLTIPMVKGYSIPLPPIIEQQAIVSILDETFASIDQAKENIQRNLQNAKDLFQSELNNIFTNKGDGWEEKKLGEVLQKTETINPLKESEKEFIYIDVSSVNKETLLIEETNLIKGKDAPSRARKLIKTNDVIFATVRPTLKRIAIITEKYNEQVCSTGYFVLRASPAIHFRLLFYYLQTFNFQNQMEKLQKGASYPAVTDNEVRIQLIAFPLNKTRQEIIVCQLDNLYDETNKLEELYQQKLNNLEELKKSILQKAFSGELTK